MHAEQHAAREHQAHASRIEPAQLADLAPPGDEQKHARQADAQRRDREWRGRGGPSREWRPGRDAHDREDEAQHGERSLRRSSRGRYDELDCGLPWSSSTVSAIAIALRARATIASSLLIFWYARSTCSW